MKLTKLHYQNVISRLPTIFRSKSAQFFLFQFISTFLLVYGITASVYFHSQKQKKNNPYIDILVGCFCYFGLLVSGKISGAQMNPAITFANNYIQKIKQLKWYLTGQSLGGITALLMGYFIYDVNLAPYSTQQSFKSCCHDMIGEIFGTFIFAFFIFTVTRKGYLSGYMFGYFNISASLLVSRAFTFRKGCLNPIIGLYSQIIIAIEKSNFMLIFYSLPVIIGPILGGLLAAFLFVKFYHPLIIQLQNQEINKKN